ncbi:DNA polymerase III gamma subunit /DNA polymerase III tau subunit [Sinobacterium caligoides]|uniref:DNA polymerase III subunit gamma/tau n=1 Tax=Sinobacterium caligoides TaxID=933926 RepID=A0A3N2DKL5_9GAMM|nr:DNA polymerase III subunit gamma/tau [Sinobacterium caligoides]ROS00343.1 DNA polymerase III gamma subunit /DNA polymerase III tau subunit [Sinobacterium caligoides]
MSYQVLARKWRPKSFKEMVGQEHVLRALINALDRQRLHHAYLFTGTRGVGKTTIARILAKCLNCDDGVSSEPCGQCGACTQIADGRFIDLIEVDAASRTKVEDTRELLENVQYAPTAGRYKVYLIDEVHMLSNSSFNALLKTLEEPPPHVKFLLATTDPQKLPATVLSRCLQFNLKNMSPDRIVGHLEYVLGEESVAYDEPALWSLSRAADGSMRDALSLADQAIAYGSGEVREADVTMMLGTIDQHAVYRLLLALSAQNGAQLLAEVALMAEHAADFGSALEELLSVLHRVAIAQTVPEALDNSYGDKARISELAGQVTAEDVQLFYQLGLSGRRDLPLAPDARSGFEMLLLRMLAFKPVGIPELPTQTLAETAASAPVEMSPESLALADSSPAPSAAVKKTEPTSAEAASEADDVPPWDTETPYAKPAQLSAVKSTTGKAATSQASQRSAAPEPVAPEAATVQPAVTETVAKSLMEMATASSAPSKAPEPKAARSAAMQAISSSINQPAAKPPETKTVSAPTPTPTPAPAPVQPAARSNSVAEMLANTPVEQPEPEQQDSVAVDKTLPLSERLELTAENWPALYLQLSLNRVVKNIASNCILTAFDGESASFILDERQATLYNEGHQDKLALQLSDYLQRTVKVVITPAALTAESPALRRERIMAEQLQHAVELVESDPNIDMLRQQFGAVVIPGSIRPLLS